jgi:hypothetical protein
MEYVQEGMVSLFSWGGLQLSTSNCFANFGVGNVGVYGNFTPDFC